MTQISRPIRIGLIDNLVNIDYFLSQRFHEASASQVMEATGGNTGNVAFVLGARKMLGGTITRVGWGWDPEVVRARFDHLVICCANQLGSHADLGQWADRLENFGLPVTLFGLGAQTESVNQIPSIPEGTIRFLQVVSNCRREGGFPNIAVRGAFTKNILHNLGFPSENLGCPSLMISSDRGLGVDFKSISELRGISKVAVAAGNPWHGSTAFLEKILVEIVDNYRGAYVLQHPESMLQFALGEKELINQKTIDRFLAVYEIADVKRLIDWYQHNACFFVDAPNWIRFLRSFDMVIGPRYHGVALGVQAGVPGCVFTIDGRTEELCEETAIKRISAQGLQGMKSNDIVEMSIWTESDVDKFRENRLKKGTKFLHFIEGNGLVPSEQLMGLALG
ncbi:polysaccharide pyruvyl transferase family protein [Cupriavidus sp. MP-37]|uniref:polysaccharide pyruvyl transferase family protein n=1 Tax=Cupriavidus sp. MP-37 TaxID=2884455 RepID=UPI001D0AD4CE|nr:polysaccharide pyruvyl transferase family protein [Cupriavidus sp. MP-37]UDM53336.1 polysaccharide pyruvyl transferase family protein [Cupriavidus sp. MP-37]